MGPKAEIFSLSVLPKEFDAKYSRPRSYGGYILFESGDSGVRHWCLKTACDIGFEVDKITFRRVGEHRVRCPRSSLDLNPM